MELGKREVRASAIVLGGLLGVAFMPMVLGSGSADAKGSQNTQTVAKSGFVLQLTGPISETVTRSLAQVGATITQRYETMPMVAVQVPAAALPALRALDGVRHVSPDLEVQKTMEFAAPAVGAQGG